MATSAFFTIRKNLLYTEAGQVIRVAFVLPTSVHGFLINIVRNPTPGSGSISQSIGYSIANVAGLLSHNTAILSFGYAPFPSPWL